MFLKECLDVVPIPHVRSCWHARSHRIAAIIKDQIREDQRRPGSRDLSHDAALGEHRPNGIA
jgi:hypothetical protein